MTSDGPDKNFADALPLVARDIGNRPLWLGLGGIVLFALILFWVLESSRAQSTQSRVAAPVEDVSFRSGSANDLQIPDTTQSAMLQATAPIPRARNMAAAAPSNVRPRQAVAAPAPFVPGNSLSSDSEIISPLLSPGNGYAFQSAPRPSAPLFVFDGGAPLESAASQAPLQSSSTGPTAGLRSTIKPTLRPRRAGIVPQGTIIPAVMETAIDSDQAGQVRALVAYDVTDMDKRTILIPRGSRLFGEYKGDATQGQKRVQILWTRLVLPQGATLAIDSPASDLMGRTGVKADVNSHFLTRFGNALLQSTLDFGLLAANRSVSGTTIIVPGTSAVQSLRTQGDVPKPTLRVKAGTSVAVFVAQDMDLSTVGIAR
jgi:type IV secretion system protein VirB10